MTEEEKAHFIAAFKNLEDYENWLFFFRLLLFTVLCFALAWTLQAAIL